MEPAVIVAAIGAIVSFMTVVIGYSQWRRDVKIKLDQIREEVSIELVRQRIEPYADFMDRLAILSSHHLGKIREDRPSALAAEKMLQEAVYGKVGLLASHNTRQILLYVREGYRDFIAEKITDGELIARLWALHYTLRGDLGISQPAWPSEIERVHRDASLVEDQIARGLITSYDWSKVDLAQRNPNSHETESKKAN